MKQIAVILFAGLVLLSSGLKLDSAALWATSYLFFHPAWEILPAQLYVLPWVKHQASAVMTESATALKKS